MPQEGYGRSVKSQSDYGATRRAYQYSPKAAEDYLSGDAAAAYESAKNTAFKPYAAGAGFRAARPEVAAREKAWDQVDRLREIAGTHALGDFTQAASQLSKPYKMQAAQGLLTEPTEAGSSDTEPVMTAHPGRMAMSDTDTWGNVRSWADRRHSLENRGYQADEAYNLLNDNDSRLALKAQLAQRSLGLGSSMARNPQPVYANTYSQYGRSLLPQGVQSVDAEKEYAGY